MIGNDDRRAADVVRVVRLGELMAKTSRRIGHAWTTAPLVRRVGGIDLDLDRIDAGWNHWLAVTAIEHEVLPAQLEHVRVRPARADALEAVAGHCAATPIRPRSVAIVHVVWVGVEHAEAALRRLPHRAIGADQLVRGVMLKVKMRMTGREL